MVRRGLWLALVCGLIAGAGAFLHQSAQRNRGVEAAREALQRGAPQEALARVEKWSAFGLSADNPVREVSLQAWLALAEEAGARGDIPAARQALARARDFVAAPADGKSMDASRLAVDRAEVTVLRQRGRASEAAAQLLKLGDVAQAIEILTAAGRHAEAAQILLDRREFAAAAQAWVRAGEFAKAADLYAEKLRDAPRAKEQWLAAGQAAAAAAKWTEAAALFRRGEHWGDAVDALVKAGEAGDAVRLARVKSVPPLVFARALRADGQLREAARCLETAGALDDAVALYREARSWDDAANLLAQQLRYADAARLLESAGRWPGAAEMWSAAKDEVRAYEAWVHCLDEAFAQGHERAAQQIGEIRSAPMRARLASAMRSRFDPLTQRRELGAFLAQAGEWADCAATYEAAGMWAAAIDAEERLGDRPARARLLCAAARAERDFDLALRAANAARTHRDENGEREMAELAIELARTAERPEWIVRAYRAKSAEVEGAEVLLSLAESWLGGREVAAMEALTSAASLLPQVTYIESIKRLYARAEKLNAALTAWQKIQPRVEMNRSSLTNFFLEHKFENCRGKFHVVNPSGRRITRFRLQVELFDRAPESYVDEDKVTGGRWSWSDPRFVEAMNASKADYLFETDLRWESEDDFTTVEITTSNRIPYRKWRVRVVSVTYQSEG